MIRMMRNIGEIATERGGLMKMGIMMLFVALGYACATYNGSFIFQNETGGVVFNIPQLLLIILLSLINIGFYIGIIKNRMNGGEGFLPRLDFVKFMLDAIYVIPFFIVWSLYFSIFMVIVGLLMVSLKSAPLAAMILFTICFFIMFLMLSFGFVAIYNLHVANFSYKHVLNPLSIFSVVSNTALPIFGLSLVYSLIVTLCTFVIAFLGANVPEVISFLISFIILIFMQSAYIARIADLVREKLEDTEFAECFKVVDDMPEGFDRYAYRNPSDEQ